MGDDGPTEIPAAFWQGLGSDDFAGIVRRDGLLTRAQTLQVWQMVGGGMPPPDGRIRVVLHEGEFERWLQSLQQH
jgi:hypothetical protein